MTYQDVEILKANIIDKFGSVSRFAKILKMEVQDNGYNPIAKLFAACRRKLTPDREKELIILKDKCERMNPNHYAPDELTLADLLRLKKAVEERGGIAEVCRDFNFNEKSLFEILDGGRTYKTKKIQRLFNKLKIS